MSCRKSPASIWPAPCCICFRGAKAMWRRFPGSSRRRPSVSIKRLDSAAATRRDRAGRCHAAHGNRPSHGPVTGRAADRSVAVRRATARPCPTVSRSSRHFSPSAIRFRDATDWADRSPRGIGRTPTCSIGSSALEEFERTGQRRIGTRTTRRRCAAQIHPSRRDQLLSQNSTADRDQRRSKR